MKQLKVYLADIKDDSEGVDKISFVHDPAFERSFKKYSETAFKYTITDNEKRHVFGPVILANHNVLRNDPPLGLHYIRYTPEIIEKIAIKFAKDKNSDRVNVFHQFDVEGVTMFESFIKNKDRVLPVGYEDISDGSWFATFKVDNDKVWSQIKDGTFTGFSMEIFHSYIDSGKTETFHYNNNFNNMAKKETAVLKTQKRNAYRAAFQKAYGKKSMNYDSVWTDRGELAVDGDFALQKEVMLFTQDNDPIQAPDGVYTINEGDLSGETITVENGVIIAMSMQSADEMQDVDGDGIDDSGASVEQADGAEIVATATAIEALAESINNMTEDLTEMVEEAVEYRKAYGKGQDRISALETQVASCYSILQDIQRFLKVPVTTPEEPKKKYKSSGMDKKAVVGMYAERK